MAYKYRVYEEGLKIGKEIGLFNDIEKAKECFNKVREKTCTAVKLQTLDEKWGWVDKVIDEYITPGWKERVEAYWQRMEEEEEPWHAGDPKWNAPGMSIHDFI